MLSALRSPLSALRSPLSALLPALALMLAAAPGLAQTFEATFLSRSGFTSFNNFDRLEFTYYEAHGDGRFHLRMDPGHPDDNPPDYPLVLPTVTVTDEDGESVDWTWLEKTDVRPLDEIEFEVLDGVQYLIVLQWSDALTSLNFAWGWHRPRPDFLVLFGDDGDDVLTGGPLGDFLFGSNGNDTLRGGDGDDTLYGNADDDRLYGNAGDDTLYGVSGDDLLKGGQGKDKLIAGTGDDRLDGGKGHDVVYGGPGGDDIMTGGPGRDRFWIGPLTAPNDYDVEDGHKVIKDFKRGKDLILLGDDGWPSVADILASVQVDGRRHVYTLAPGLTLETRVALDADDFGTVDIYNE